MRRAFPALAAIVSYPELFEPGAGRTRMNQRHNAAVKQALRQCLEHHHRHTWPKHFQFGAHRRYRYGQRSPRTLLIKSKRGRRYLDLVLSGKAKRNMTSPAWPRIRVRGATYSGKRVVATMTIRWPADYKDRANARPEHITKRKMTDELERWTRDEERSIADRFARLYTQEMRRRIRTGGRVTKRFGDKLHAQGIL